MYSVLMIISIWAMRFSMLFSLVASTVKTNTPENSGKLPMPIKIMWIHLLCAGFIQIMMTTLSQSHQNNAFLAHLYVVEEFTMDMLFYREILRKGAYNEEMVTKRPVFLIAIVVFAAFAIINASFITDINHFPIYTFLIQSVVTVICATSYIRDRSYNGDDPIAHAEYNSFKTYKGPVFYINMGKLIYFFFACPLFIICTVAMENKEQNTASLLWIAQHFLLSILHIFMGVGFLKFTSNPSKVMDFMTRERKKANAEQRNMYINDPAYAAYLQKRPNDFRDFKADNPDLFGEA